jgi:peptide/nickel transport system permease protein
MARYVGRRLIQVAVTLVIFQSLLFVILDAQPGDITNLYLTNPKITPEARDVIRANLGLDRPPLERYLQWMKNAVTGNLGVSFMHWPRTVIDVVLERAPRTLFLFVTAQLMSFAIGFALGKQLAWRRGTAFEYRNTVIGVLLYTVFTPWFGLMMLIAFGLWLKLLPVGKFLDPMLWRRPEYSALTANQVFYLLIATAVLFALASSAVLAATRRLTSKKRRGVRVAALASIAVVTVIAWALSGIGVLALDMLHHMILPVTVYTLVTYAGSMLLMRNTMLETLGEDYVMAAKAKGLPDSVVRDRHAARNALLPVMTFLVINLPFALSGGIITESVFSWEGMGLTLLQAVQNEDIPLAMGALSVIGILALVAHLVADVMYAFLDPRIRYE